MPLAAFITLLVLRSWLYMCSLNTSSYLIWFIQSDASILSFTASPNNNVNMKNHLWHSPVLRHIFSAVSRYVLILVYQLIPFAKAFSQGLFCFLFCHYILDDFPDSQSKELFKFIWQGVTMSKIFRIITILPVHAQAWAFIHFHRDIPWLFGIRFYRYNRWILENLMPNNHGISRWKWMNAHAWATYLIRLQANKR